MVSWKLLRRGRRSTSSVPVVGDENLVAAVSGDDEAAASSTALAEAGFDGGTVVLRHTLWVPGGDVETVIARCLGLDYVVDESVHRSAAADGLVLLAVARTIDLDAVVLSRERARMASLASRAGGRIGGWAVLRAPDTA